MKLPILYNFRRCPYAMRARLALSVANIDFEQREIELKNKPASMLKLSPKGTVPVLQLQNGDVLEESLDIMNWALEQADPEHWLANHSQQQINQTQALIAENDNDFKHWLDRYKYADRYPDKSQSEYRDLAGDFLQQLEQGLQSNTYLLGKSYSMVDAAIMPFVRQFSFVDRNWFDESPYPFLRKWLDTQIASERFIKIMQKKPIWQEPSSNE